MAFSLGTLLLLVTLTCIWLARVRARVDQQRKAIAIRPLNSLAEGDAMSAIRLARRLDQHRRRVNLALLETAAQLSPQQIRAPFSIGQGSVWRSLLHLYAAEFVWLEALLGNEDPLVPGDSPDELPGNQQCDSVFADVADLAAAWRELDGRWERYLAALRETDLERPVAKKSTSSGKGKVFRTRTSDVLLHVCTHAQYTTAQVINMFRQLGVRELPDAMLISMAREETD